MWRVICPYENKFVLSKNIKPKYWLFKDLSKIPKKYLYNLSTEALIIGKGIYAKTTNGERLLKNTKIVGNTKYWVLNGQAFYSGVVHHRVRANIARFYHNMLEAHIKKQISRAIDIPESNSLKISVDIYELNQGIMPDVDNLWPLEKWFTDSLVHLGIIPDDSPKYIRSNGQKTYIWVDNEEDRKLVFNIEII